MNTELQNIWGPLYSQDEALSILQKDISVYNSYLSLTIPRREEVIRFLCGKESLCITYDAVFKKIFSFEYHQDRIEKFISDILGRPVTIESELSREGSLISENGSFIIMDIIVRDVDGSLINVEMQKNGYQFLGERADCYISDAILRQYNREKERQGADFSYRSLKTCYLIVLMENSPGILLSKSPEYIHLKNQTYSSGAKIESLSNIRFISLDTYEKVSQNKSIETSLDAWLTFLSTKDFARINQLINKYPEYLEIYQEIADIRQKPKELIGMYLSSFAETDRAEERYMVNEMKKELEQKNSIIAEKENALAEKNIALADKDNTIAEQAELIKQLQAQIKKE